MTNEINANNTFEGNLRIALEDNVITDGEINAMANAIKARGMGRDDVNNVLIRYDGRRCEPALAESYRKLARKLLELKTGNSCFAGVNFARYEDAFLCAKLVGEQEKEKNFVTVFEFGGACSGTIYAVRFGAPAGCFPMRWDGKHPSEHPIYDSLLKDNFQPAALCAASLNSYYDVSNYEVKKSSGFWKDYEVRFESNLRQKCDNHVEDE